MQLGSMQEYGPDILDAVASGDLAVMKEAASRAQRYLDEHGDVGAALAMLQVEIAKAATRPRSEQG
jgi:Domain of unknown function (DUF1843)